MPRTATPPDGPFREPVRSPYTAAQLAEARGRVVCCITAQRVEVLNAPERAVIDAAVLSLRTRLPDALQDTRDAAGRRVLVIGHKHANSGRAVYEVVESVDGADWLIGQRIA